MSNSKKVEFTIRGRRKSLTEEQVKTALKKVDLGHAQIHTVEVNGVSYPLKKAFAKVTEFDVLDFQTAEARAVFIKLGFKVSRNNS